MTILETLDAINKVVDVLSDRRAVLEDCGAYASADNMTDLIEGLLEFMYELSECVPNDR